MTKTLADELTEQGIDKESFLKVYNVAKAVSGIYFPDLIIPGVSKYELKRIFGYFEEIGLSKKTDKDHYEMRPDGIKTMNARIESLKIKPKPVRTRKTSGE